MAVEVPTTNRLIHEKSPYLLQHAGNPVDWYPWGDEAFAKAGAEGKFVFLSVGYSTCHWCHVMERESFENRDVAALLNSVAVAVKVDREERPDLDQVYMAVCQGLNGSGGWPLTVLLTPERKPFFAGTYFPKESRLGRMGLVDLLRRAGALWQQNPENIRSSADEILQRLSASVTSLPEGSLGPEAFGRGVELFCEQHDAARGGFGGAPKFPTPHNLVFLLRRYRRTGDARTLHMVETTLDAMVRGGLWDHLGGGFHRYSTDVDWLLPHFEKMLYDQAGLAGAYLEAFQVTRNPRWADVARAIFDYVARDLLSPEGAFFCAEDADSEGVEGKFYVWTSAEIAEALGDDADLFCKLYGVTPSGNFLEEASRERTGLNVLHLPRPLTLAADDERTAPSKLESRLSTWRAVLFQRREGRIRPHRDDKILAGWNGLMISALAQGARILEEREYAEQAVAAARFVLSRMTREGRLLRRWRDGEAAVPAFAEDYAFLALGLLELYAATFDPHWLAEASALSRDLIQLFWDDEKGGLFDAANDAESLVLRPKEAYDGATPSANSVALEVFARLWLLTGDQEWGARARRMIATFGGKVSSYPPAFTWFLRGAAYLLEPTREVVVVGEPQTEDTRSLLAALRNANAPETTVVFVPVTAPQAIEALAPHVSQTRLVQGRAAAYLCEGFACRAPIVDAAALTTLLSTPPPMHHS